MRNYWWKILSGVLILYAIIAGFLGTAPLLEKGGLYQSIRNLYFHVPMWFNMTLLFFIAAGYSIAYLRTFDLKYDVKAADFTRIGLLFSILGMITGIEWANFTWSSQTGQRGLWTNDPKQICAAISILSYFAYLILRQGIKDDEKRAKLSAVYNVFACGIMVPLIFIIPRLATGSLHPGGKEGNPAFDPKDLDIKMRIVFWPAVLGWFLLSLWIANIKIKISLLQNRNAEN